MPAAAEEPDQRPEFTRLVAHWAEYAHSDYLPFVEEAQVEVAQIGFYGGHFYSLSHTPHGKGYPAHFPVEGLDEQGEWFERLNAELHRRQIKVVGHFNVKFLVGDPDHADGPRGFFKFYRDLWDEAELGPRPVASAIDLLERDRKGKPLVNTNYSIGGMAEYWGCLNNPHWRAVLKAWTRRGIQRGVDGYMINYFYRHNCLCDHCQTAFKTYLQERCTPEELKRKFEIADLKQHQFDEIVAWHDPQQSTPLRREMLRFSQIANKRAFDEVFIEYGRSLKPGLIVAQWNHLGNFNQISGDERSLLPAELWGRGEDYLWYSTGASAHFTDLAEGLLGEGTLQARYIRGSFDDKPFTLGKYESTRTRVAISELAANGGAAMGFYTRFTDPLARQEIVRYYGFLKRYDDMHHASRSYAEVALLYPRRAILEGDLQPLENFRRTGTQLLDEHVLFDVLPDDAITSNKLTGYRHVIRLEAAPASSDDLLPDKVRGTLSRFKAPTTVRVSANRPSFLNELTLHFVNYNRQEPEKKRSAGRGIKDEKPLAAPPIDAEIVLPAGQRFVSALSMTPEQPDPLELKTEQLAGRLRLTVPEFLVYSVVRIGLAPAK